MPTYSKLKGSGSTSGKGIPISVIATPGTILHTSISGSLDMDEIWVYAVNVSASDVMLTLEYGGVAVADNIPILIPAYSGLKLVVPGFVLNGGLAVRAFAGVANVINCHIYVNRITA
jgi:hypothetical protein